MRFNLPLAFAILTLAGAWFAPVDAVDDYVAKAQAAQTLEATLNVQPVGGSPYEITVVLAKPGSFRVETPTHLYVSNGGSFWTLDKKANTYSIGEAGPDSFRHALDTRLLEPWVAFFDAKWKERVAGSVAGRERTMRGAEISELTVTYKPQGPEATLFVDKATGLVRGGVMPPAEGKTEQRIVFATQLRTNRSVEQLAQSFTFQAPEGAQEASSDVMAPTFQDVLPILRSACFNCHGDGVVLQARLDLRTYDTVMRGGVSGSAVIAGDSAKSHIVERLNKRGPGMMPPGRPLASDQVAKIQEWIDGGAKP